jgi:hypothetical protein
MKKEDQVVSLEHAKEMEELGLKQDSIWYWTWAQWTDKVEWVLISQEERKRLKKESFAALTVAELGEALKGEIIEWGENFTKRNPYYLDCGKIEHEHSYYVRYIRHDTGDTFCITHGNTEANARAKLWLHLRKKGLI